MDAKEDLATFVLSLHTGDLSALVNALVGRLRSMGIPLWRLTLGLLAMHPELASQRVQWTEEQGCLVIETSRALLKTPTYTESPIAAVTDGAPRIRRRLAPPHAELDYPICLELRDQGATDYLVLPMIFSDGRRRPMTFATRAPGGFSDAHLALFESILPALSARMEILTARAETKSLLEVYLGSNAARRVLAGEFVRGSGTSIDAAIWTCDLRGFTALADDCSPVEVIRTLDAYFERVVYAIQANGGEVLKFIGDAVLAIFPIDSERATACGRALLAARRAVVDLAAWNAARAAPLGMGVGLHLGEVFYGNVGGASRLDFTVIGAAVNMACRLEPLCKTLAASIVMSAAFRAHVSGDDIIDGGEHFLRGVSRPQRVYLIP